MSTENQPEIDIEKQDVDQSEQDTETTQEINQESIETQVEALQAALLEAEAKVDAQKDSVIRAKAEADNARKRSIQEVDKARKFALEKFAGELLPVLDNLERALQVPNADDEAVKPLIAGVEMTMKLFLSTIEKFDLNVVDPQGQSFNPDLHQAMAMQPAEGVAPNTVISVMQKGYTLNGRLLRPALVMVSKAADGGVDTQA